MTLLDAQGRHASGVGVELRDSQKRARQSEAQCRVDRGGAKVGVEPGNQCVERDERARRVQVEQLVRQRLGG